VACSGEIEGEAKWLRIGSNGAPLAGGRVIKGGRVACSGIRMNDIPQFPYRILWEERQILSVANLTRQDPVTFCPSR
jgi:hypothetical protein